MSSNDVEMKEAGTVPVEASAGAGGAPDESAAAAGSAAAASAAAGEAGKSAAESAEAAPAPAEPQKPEPEDHRKTGVSDEVVVEFDHVTKTYHLYKNDKGRLLGVFGVRKPGWFLGDVNANNNLTFKIRKGEAVAFLGRNGAGKSTALKMITGVVYPTEGEVKVSGRVSALLELTAGFDMKLTGRENIALRGQIMGLSNEEIARLEPKVIEFADLGLYIDQPMRTYSSGMKARLGFGFAVGTDPEILVVDEALSVGDKAFKEKCVKRIREIMMDENVTVLFVSHSSSTVREFCSRGIVLDHGTEVFDGPIEEAVAYYETNY